MKMGIQASFGSGELHSAAHEHGDARASAGSAVLLTYCLLGAIGYLIGPLLPGRPFLMRVRSYARQLVWSHNELGDAPWSLQYD